MKLLKHFLKTLIFNQNVNNGSVFPLSLSCHRKRVCSVSPEVDLLLVGVYPL